MYFHRNWKYEQDLASLLWKVDYDDIKRKGQNGSARSVGSRVSINQEGALKPKIAIRGGRNSSIQFGSTHSRDHCILHVRIAV